MQDAAQHSPILYLSPEHACGYLPDRQARTVFLDPRVPPDAHLYSRLIQRGFRRSGAYLYRPECPHCRACVPARIPVAEFNPDRGQRRVWKRNRDIEIAPQPAEFQQEYFELYHSYLKARHAGGGMDDASPGDFRNFLLGPWGETRFVEMRLAGKLIAVAVMDQLPDAVSAVYIFYDPSLRTRSLGTFAILWQIEEARRLALRWLYLGYWIAESPKMTYKNRFQPLELLRASGWERSV